MLSDRLNRRLEGITDASKKGYSIRNLHRLMYEKDLWIEAYANLQANQGVITKGVDKDTLDGFSNKQVDQIIKVLREKTYRPKPVRRTYIPKSNGKKRPLGIPSGTDKLVQEVARIILERIYEPIFSNDSHGFRPGRSCHTALSKIGTRWNGTKWILDVDIEGCFDNIDHRKLLDILRKKIDDERFVGLIAGMLKAGYVEDWKYHRTYSGTPQGGVVSPILANIYLHELDEFIGGLKKTFNTGKLRRWNPEYQHHRYKIHHCRKEIDTVKDDPTRKGEVSELRRAIDRHGEAMRQIPSQDMSDPNFKRLRYSRYADDLIIGVIGSKANAECLMRQVKTFLAQELNLQTSEEKTAIRHIEDGCTFLGYEVRQALSGKVMKGNLHGRHTKRRTISAIVSLYVPKQVAHKFCHEHGYGDYQNMRSLHRANLLALSDSEIIATYNAELRGLAEYYALACDVKRKLSKLFYMAHHSLFKTIANKHKVQSMKQILRTMAQGGEYVYRYKAGDREYRMKVYRLKHLNPKGKGWQVDKVPTTAHYTTKTTELVKRLNAEQCEYCGQGGPCEVHHVRKLKDLKRKREKPMYERMMIARGRKTMVLCEQCHHQLHSGTLPDNRYARS
ncbi:MAG: group II intron reverse transcriptase/maturase [Rubrobacter sp.]|nr:group II intron reverse transcriptase/maturase [Rubrobacter sp.]